jgi:hypothetical protein
MAHMGEGILPSASGNNGKGYFRRKRMVRSSGAESSSVACISVVPKGSRFAQRWMLATQSRASTFSPSCHNRPGRSVRFQSLPSFSMLCPSSICGCILKLLSMPYSVSNTR